MYRPRRLRQNKSIRSLVQETTLHTNDLILPIFVHDQLESISINSLYGHQRMDEITLLKHCEEILKAGIKGIAIFPSIDPDKKNSECSEAVNNKNLMCHLTKRIKRTFGDDLLIIGDIALDPYSSDGHDGLVANGQILNDETVALLAQMAVVQAEAGVDIVAPSDMMDGRVLAIREALDEAGFSNTMIMSYSAKYASSLYGPFRDALNSVPKSGNKRTYQMNPSNRTEAGVELDLDIAEGADIVMVKPATMYLDIISDFSVAASLPVAAYHVSGEYAMLKAASEKGFLNFHDALFESLTSIKRAGASMILTYGALEAAELIQSGFSFAD